MKRVLVLTAGFGEGHNTAARSIRDALEATGEAEVRVGDLYANATPRVNSTVKVGYSFAINRAPWLWRLIFLWLDRPGWMEGAMWTTGPLRKELERIIGDFRPDIIVATYPLYAYLFRKIQKSRLGVRMPFVTVVTDSVGVNSAWHRCLSDAFVVADAETEQLLVSRGVPPAIVHPLGFPVSLFFASATPIPATADAPWKLLFMPSTQIRLTLRQIQALTELPDVELTVVAGRHVRIFDAVNESGLLSSGKHQLIGWTDAMPRLLCEHHAFIGKAGGAIVQEAIAARCPFLVSHLVPGQEEGNIALIERLGVGAQALGGPEQLAEAVGKTFANNARVWRGWKQNLDRLDAADASGRVARFVLGFKTGAGPCPPSK
ncbi:MAG: MGDG synthase family glycosyltransferase [Chthoniobacterales bacterium]